MNSSAADNESKPTATRDPESVLYLVAGRLPLREDKNSHLPETPAPGAVDPGGEQAMFPGLERSGAGRNCLLRLALRHCHDLDVWVDPADRDRAEKHLKAIGLTAVDQTPEKATYLSNVARFHVVLHTRLFPIRYFDPAMELIYQRSQSAPICGVEVRILAASDMLGNLLAFAACGVGRRKLRWACVVLYLLRRTPDLDWDLLVETSLYSRLGLPFVVVFRYLLDELDAPIPPDVINQLRRGRQDNPDLGEVLVRTVRVSTDLTRLQLLSRAPTLGVKLSALRWLTLPSPSYLHRELEIEGFWKVVREYAARFLRWCAN